MMLGILTVTMTSVIIGICAFLTVQVLHDSYFVVEFMSCGSIIGRHYASARDRDELLHRLLRIRKRDYTDFEDDELTIHIIQIDEDTYRRHI